MEFSIHNSVVIFITLGYGDEDSSVRSWVAGTVGYNFGKLTEDYRNLLFELTKDTLFGTNQSRHVERHSPAPHKSLVSFIFLPILLYLSFQQVLLLHLY